jgi:hypothetical protein
MAGGALISKVASPPYDDEHLALEEMKFLLITANDEKADSYKLYL